MYKNIWVIVNPISGGRKNKQKSVDYISECFSKNSHTCIQYTTQRGDASRFAQKAVEDGVELVIVFGGDGTINEVASQLVKTNVSLAIIPAGSGNGLARSLGIPQKLEKACQLIDNGYSTLIDVGKANDRYFFLVAGFGFDAVVGKKFDEYHRRGPLPYFYLSAKEYIKYKPNKIRVHFNNINLEISPFLLAIANGSQYGNNATIAPRAKLNDGLLDISIIHRLQAVKLPDATIKLFSGRFDRFSEAETHKSDSILIEREQRDLINIDGEAFVEEPKICISVIPKTLRVICPKDNEGLVK